MTNSKSKSTPTALYDRQIRIVEALAAKTTRSFSNAMQFIIEDWYAKSDPEGVLLREYKASGKRGRRTYHRAARPLEAISGVQKGIAE